MLPEDSLRASCKPIIRSGDPSKAAGEITKPNPLHLQGVLSYSMRAQHWEDWMQVHSVLSLHNFKETGNPDPTVSPSVEVQMREKVRGIDL
ncbi:hypothetical protein L3X38_022740 [Prunus dulcis]|uniref:Uncharacterized protein n=1 Tax=Prunus dulcis TaxID=3755 RepID=A0AAD4VZ25_PRUDU|nr:hypothetical protein L3X38_022740 [Prunus dulcis]